jgi:hypothetical protein
MSDTGGTSNNFFGKPTPTGRPVQGPGTPQLAPSGPPDPFSVYEGLNDPFDRPPAAVAVAVASKTAPARTVRTRKGRKPPTPAGASTWFVGLLLILFLLIAPSNPAAGAVAIGGFVLLTGLYTAATGRPSWARIKSRGQATAPIILAGILLATSYWLPTSLVVAPAFLTKAPTPNAAQTVELSAGLIAIDQRFTSDWDEEKRVAKAIDVCANDFASQTPAQNVEGIRTHLLFSVGEKLTTTQARQVIETVRATFCGQPGEREEAAGAELKYSFPAAIDQVTDLVNELVLLVIQN